MTLTLHSLMKPPRKVRRRVGRGTGSGRGTYSGRGVKGQRARSGGRSGLRRRALMRLLTHLPKVRGFHSSAPTTAAVTLDRISARFPSGSHVTVDALRAAGLVPRRAAWVKVLCGRAPVTKKFSIVCDAFSRGAERTILAAGGSVLRTRDRKNSPPER